MSFRFARRLGALLPVVLLASAASADPLITGYVGSGSQTSFLVIDFKSAPAPQSVAFGYRYDGVKTGGDLLDALSSNLSGFVFEAISFPGFGRFVDRLGYDGRILSGNDPGSETFYWAYFTSPDSLTWSYASVGFDARVLMEGSWDGYSWTDFTVGNGEGTAPIVPTTAAAAPEPGTLALLGIGLGAALIRRRTSPRRLYIVRE
jgi:hypothetical protein